MYIGNRTELHTMVIMLLFEEIEKTIGALSSCVYTYMCTIVNRICSIELLQMKKKKNG